MQQVPETNTMKLMFQLEQPQSPMSGSNDTCQADNQSVVVPTKPIATADSFEKKGHSWFAVSQVPTDLSIQVQDITFYVHKYPLATRCSYFSRIEIQSSKSNPSFDIKLDNFPGGSETFETILKFCYGFPISLNPNNIAAIRCASEFLEMTEALEDGNLISKTEGFFTFVVLSSWRDSVTVLKSCETLSPWAENLQLVRRCSDSISWKISQEASTIGNTINGEKWSFHDIVTLRIDHFTRIITALKVRQMEPETIGSCIMAYGDKWLPNTESEREVTGSHNHGRNELQWNIMNGRGQDWDIGETREQRMIVESLVSILPPQKEAVSCNFLLKMLKMAILYSASPVLISDIEMRTGLVLESANVKDLLIPSYAAVDRDKLVNSKEEHSMHNIDVVQRILEYFLLYEQQQLQQQQLPQPGPLAISKLLDNYLAEIARDPKLPVTKFQVLAQSLPENARTCDDGLYRAIDTYLKTHPLLSDYERRRVCKVMDCSKLSLDACAHAAQNYRLPLRTVIQVLFSEQVKIRASIQVKGRTETIDNLEQESNWSSTNKEVKTLKLELEKVRMQMAEIQRDYSELQQEHGKQNIKRRYSLGWTFGWRKVRNSALFNVKLYRNEINASHGRPSQSQRGSLQQRQSIS